MILFIMETATNQALQKAIAAHRLGKIEEAEHLYRLILKTQPTNSDANHNLGVLLVSLNKSVEALPFFKTAVETNPNTEQYWISYTKTLINYDRFEEAEVNLRKAIKLKPNFAEVHNQLSIIQKTLGKFDEARISIEKAIELKPNYTEAYVNLGVILKDLGKFEEAVVNFNKLIELKPDYYESYYNLGNTLYTLGRLEEAKKNHRKALELKPNFAEGHNNLGNLLLELNKIDDAEKSYKKAIELEPDFMQAHCNLGNLLQTKKKFKEADASYQIAIKLKPDYAEPYDNLGTALYNLGRLEEAKKNHRKAIELKPDFAAAHNNLGITLQELGKLDEAEASYRQAIDLKPNFAEAHYNLGGTLQELGKLDEAEASYRQAIELKPNFAEAHRALTSMKKFDARDEQYSKMQELYLDENISEDQSCHINFGLAKACEDLGNFGQAYAHYGEGNVLRKKLLNYDINEDVELFTQIKFNYPRIANNSLEPDKLSKNLMPIFIVGMPRSGTTLVEQIISSHSKVTGAGELSFAAQFGAAIATGFSEATDEALLNFREKYLIKLQNVANGNLIVTDKMPLNFRFIGLLATAFPEAKIVNVKRNPAAVCWGNYKQYFKSKSIGYCYGLDDVVAYYALYQNLLKFWEMKLPSRIYNLDYELLTTNQDDETKKLIQNLDLDWESKCLSPQNNRRSVATASNMQVRQKIYQGSSEQWRKYEPFLNGAFDYLED